MNISWSIQRARQGEQAYWATVALTAAGTDRHAGRRPRFWLRLHQPGGRGAKSVFRPTLPAGENAVDSVIPVARLSDMLLHPEKPMSSTVSSGAIPISV